jgi:hypothetical protein
MRKTLTALALAAAMMFAAMPDQAFAQWRGGHGGWHGGHGYYGHGGYGYGGVAAGVLGGLAAGAIIGSMAGGYYGGPGYYYGGPGYYYGGPAYYAEPAPYAYEAPVYVRPARRGYYQGGYAASNGCWIATDTTRGYGYYGPCY